MDQAERHAGLLVAGRPYCAESDEMDFDFGGVEQVLPVGEILILAASVVLHRCVAVKAAHFFRLFLRGHEASSGSHRHER